MLSQTNSEQEIGVHLEMHCIQGCKKIVKKNTHSCMALINLWFEIESAINVHCIQDE